MVALLHALQLTPLPLVIAVDGTQRVQVCVCVCVSALVKKEEGGRGAGAASLHYRHLLRPIAPLPYPHLPLLLLFCVVRVRR